MQTEYKTLEQIIKARKSTRNFESEFLSPGVLMKIVESAIYAPYGGATGIPLHELRKVFIFEQGTDNMSKAKKIIESTIARNARKINMMLKILPFMKKKFGAFANRLNSLAKSGITSLADAPYLIILAEKKGFPPVEKESMAHAMENMWLTATDRGVGFQLISAVSIVAENEEFLKLLGLKEDQYELSGCAIGYPKSETQRGKNYNIDKFVTWIR